MANSKSVTIRELKAAAKRRGWKMPRVTVYRMSAGGANWHLSVWDHLDAGSMGLRDDSRQGAIRMALAALRAK